MDAHNKETLPDFAALNREWIAQTRAVAIPEYINLFRRLSHWAYRFHTWSARHAAQIEREELNLKPNQFTQLRNTRLRG